MTPHHLLAEPLLIECRRLNDMNGPYEWFVTSLDPERLCRECEGFYVSLSQPRWHAGVRSAFTKGTALQR